MKLADSRTKYAGKRIRVVDLEGSVHTFDSVREASTAMGIAPNQVYVSIAKGWKCRGCTVTVEVGRTASNEESSKLEESANG